LSFTYLTMAEADADKQQLRSMLTALDAAGNQMRLDECRTWTIRGKRGYVATWGDGKQWFIYCAPGSGRKWNNLRRDLSHLGKCTQDGDDEGIIRIYALPTPEQAVLIRKAIGLSKRPAINPEVVKANLSRPSVSLVQGHSTRERPNPAHYATQEAAE
jgi:hypothetical protein